jgi:hypothetical protein
VPKDWETIAREADEAGQEWANEHEKQTPGCFLSLVGFVVNFAVFVGLVWLALQLLGYGS